MSGSPLLEQLQSTLRLAYTIERELGGGILSRVFVARENALGRRLCTAKLLQHAGVTAALEGGMDYRAAQRSPA